MKLFRVTRPSVIEAKYREQNSHYMPSAKMSEEALTELVNHEAITQAKIDLGSLIHYANQLKNDLDRIYKKEQ